MSNSLYPAKADRTPRPFLGLQLIWIAMASGEPGWPQRNHTLSNAMKRLGVLKHSGPGVDKIHRSLRRFGRLEPGYRRTDVRVVCAQANHSCPDGALHPSSNARPSASGMMA